MFFFVNYSHSSMFLNILIFVAKIFPMFVGKEISPCFACDIAVFVMVGSSPQFVDELRSVFFSHFLPAPCVSKNVFPATPSSCLS